MTTRLITPLVVGQPRKLVLGRPVGQKLRHPSGATLRWRAGRWEGAPAPRLGWLLRLLAGSRPNAIVVPTAPATGPAKTTAAGTSRLQRFGLVGAAVAVFAAGGGLGLGALRLAPADIGDLPVAPAATVRVVEAAYVPAQQALPQLPPQEQPLPIAGPQSEDPAPVLPLGPPAPAATRTAEKMDVQAPLKPAATPDQKAAETPKAPHPAPAKAVAPRQEPQAIPAVILDEAVPRGLRPHVPAASASAAAALPVKPAASAAPAALAVSKPMTEAGVGLIAITPDGKVAVFSNPKTKLPQQFRIGEQLPGGDTIRAIDAKEGKVVTSLKEYLLD